MTDGGPRWVATANVVARATTAGPLVSSARVISLVVDDVPQNDRVTTIASVADGNEPSVTIVSMPDRIRLSWDSTDGAFKPEYRTGIDDSSPWRRLTVPVRLQGNVAFVDVLDVALVNEPLLFFRLVQP